MLPNYILHSKSITSLVRRKGKAYNDNKCFFRCISLHRGQHRNNLETYTNYLLKGVEKHTGKSFNDGVSISHIPALEVYFQAAINIYSLQENGSCDVIYLSQLPYRPMYINLYDKHFSYIHDINKYSKRYQCMMCERIFNHVRSLKKHSDICCTEIEESYNGGKLRPVETIFDWLEKEEINIPENERYYKFVSVFDYESIQVEDERVVKGRDIRYRHVPATFSISSNIPGHTKTIHVVSDGNSQNLIDKMVCHQLKQQETASRITREKFKHVIDKFQFEIQQIENQFSDLPKKKFFDKDNPVCKRHNQLKSLLASLLKYCDQLPILGFNSQKYDIPLIRQYLPSSLRNLIPYLISS